MGRSSGGAFDGAITSAYGSSGKEEPFGPNVSDRPRRRTMDDPPSYYNSYWNRSYSNNQRSWSTERDQRRGEGTPAKSGFFVVFAFFSFFVSLWMIFGLYGTQELEMGMFYSRVTKANSFFVKEIKVQNLRDKGPVARSFSTRPELGSSYPEKKTIDDYVIEKRSHKRHTYWLNKGSTLELSCTLQDPSKGSLIVAIVKGEDGFQDWKGDPANPTAALRWRRISDKGSLSFKVEEDDDYCVVFGNLNSIKLTISIDLQLSYVVYSTEKADSVCSSQITDTCHFPLSLGHTSYVLLTSPIVDLHGVDIWKIKLSYVPRWITNIFCWGLVAAGLLFTMAFEFRQNGSQATVTQEVTPLVSEDAAQFPAASAPVDYSMQTDENNSGTAGIPENQLCTLCLDAPKNSFFDPCGHRCTCYSCGLRIQRGDSNRCPICRQTIRTVRRIYDA